MTRNYVPGKEPEVEILAAPVVQTLPQRALSRRFARLRNWAPLAQLKLRWTTLQQHLAEYNWSGQYDVAVQEVRGVLSGTAKKLRGMSRKLVDSVSRREKAVAQNLDAVAVEIEDYLMTLEQSPPDPSMLYRTQQFVRDHLLSKYEELSSRCVSLRRKTNHWRIEALESLKQGRVVRCGVNLMRRPWLAFVESYLSFRFCIAALRKEL